MKQKITRRAILGAMPGSVLAAAVSKSPREQALPQAGEFVRFSDPATETPIVRLTTPAFNHVLPASGNRFVLLKPRVLYCASDRVGGRMTPHQIDLRTGVVRQVAETAALDAASLSLDAPGKFLYLLDGTQLGELPLTGKHEPRRIEVLAEGVTSFGIGASRTELFVIRGDRLQIIRGDRLQLSGKDQPVLAEDAAGPCRVRPGGGGCLFSRAASDEDCEFWYASVDSARSKPVMLARGRISNPDWSADGGSLLFLRDVPKNSVSVAELREVKPEERVERCVAATSQFATFSANGNDSVFVGASKSKAQPNVILLLRETRRELTLCEHRSSKPSAVRPAFSPDSRRIYFESDREGKSAIYSVNVEQLVEPT